MGLADRGRGRCVTTGETPSIATVTVTVMTVPMTNRRSRASDQGGHPKSRRGGG